MRISQKINGLRNVAFAQNLDTFKRLVNHFYDTAFFYYSFFGLLNSTSCSNGTLEHILENIDLILINLHQWCRIAII